MAHKFNPANKSKLDSEWRRKNLPPLPTLKKLGLGTEDVVADIGCGIGYFTIPAAEMVNPGNKIYALDTSEEMLVELDKRTAEAEISNVVAILTEEYDLKLPDQSVSFVLLINVIHEVEDKGRLLKEAFRILKPSSRIAVVDWEKKQTEMGPPIDHRISKEDVFGLLTASGFKNVKEIELHDCFYGLVAEKK